MLTAGGDRMSRVQLSLNVSDLGAAVAFYSRLLRTAPAKLRPGYANFGLDDPPLKLVLNSPGNGPGGTVNHLGVEVSSTGEVNQAGARLDAECLDTEPEPGAVCCYAQQDKVWAHDPDGVAWEYYTVLEHIETP
jgi:glyoxalase/bleomycin resistance protein/dioxygenase superfamily protein